VVVPAAHAHPVTGDRRVVAAVDTVAVVAGAEAAGAAEEEEGEDEYGFNLPPIL
jgi:hypothetical protein